LATLRDLAVAPAEARPFHIVVGANHRSSAATTRERLFIEEADQRAVLEKLSNAGLRQALLLSTCARTEVQAVAPDPERAASAIAGILAEHAGMTEAALGPELYRIEGPEAVRHVFRVAASLDSPIVGEPQVVGQVRASHGLARAAGLVGPELDSVLSAAYGAAKRVRNETTVGERPVSIAAAARQVARDVHGDLAHCAGLMLVGGDMGELVAENFLASGLGRMVVTARIPARSEAVARRYECHHAPIEELPTLLASADIVVSSLGVGAYQVTVPMVRAALRARRNRPVLLIDAAIPGDVAPEVNDLDGAFVYDLSDLERIAEHGRAGRVAASREAEDLIDEAVASYFMSIAARDAVPVITALRAHFERIREEALAEGGRDDVAQVTRRLVNRLLDAPSRALGRMAADDDAEERRRAELLLRELFGLDRSGGRPGGER
jgi:glutamyl-tRNA reductase